MPSRCTWIIWAYAASVAVASAQADFDRLLKSLRPDAYVTDVANVLNPSEEQLLEQVLADLQAKTSAQIAVVTLPSLEGGEISDFANRLFEQWGIGQRDQDNGILFLAAIGDRKVWIEVGYGLEALIPDARAGRILDQSVIPQFRAGQMGRGLVDGTMALVQIVANNANATITGARPVRAPANRSRPRASEVVFILVFLMFLFIVFRNYRRTRGTASAGGGRRGGRGIYMGGGGGFGRSGGFGGGGFGGFGGGRSGGGGAGRSW